MKGLVVEKRAHYSIILTPTGKFKKVYGVFREEVGQEIPIKSRIAVPGAVFAAIALVVIFMSLTLPAIMGQNQVYAYVTLDINPSVEFAIDEHHLVLKARPYNQEADDILTGLEYKGREVELVLAEFTRAALSLRRPDDSEPNRVLVSFYSEHIEDEQSAEAELTRIMEAQRKVLQSSGEQIAINTVVIDRETYREAHRLGVSAGRLKETRSKADKETEQKTEEISEKESSGKGINNPEPGSTKEAVNDEGTVKGKKDKERKESNKREDSAQNNGLGQNKKHESKADKEVKNKNQADKKQEGKGQNGKEKSNTCKKNNKKDNKSNRKYWNNKDAKKKYDENEKKTQSNNSSFNRRGALKQLRYNEGGKDKYYAPYLLRTLFKVRH